MSYHERVARRMKQTYMAGSLNTYETILAALHAKFPSEDALRAYIGEMERWARACGAGDDWSFLNDN